jgi:predicted nucleotidyltransferase
MICGAVDFGRLRKTLNFMATISQINDIAMMIADKIHPDKIILFGSYAKGNYNNSSDIDLIIVKQSDLPKPHRGLEIQKIFYRSLIAVDIKFYTLEEYKSDLNNKYSFLSSVIKESAVLYERKN